MSHEDDKIKVNLQTGECFLAIGTTWEAAVDGKGSAMLLQDSVKSVGHFPGLEIPEIFDNKIG